eukprot:753045-Hanusia_phi.AAC.1
MSSKAITREVQEGETASGRQDFADGFERKEEHLSFEINQVSEGFHQVEAVAVINGGTTTIMSNDISPLVSSISQLMSFILTHHLSSNHHLPSSISHFPHLISNPPIIICHASTLLIFHHDFYSLGRLTFFHVDQARQQSDTPFPSHCSFRQSKQKLLPFHIAHLILLSCKRQSRKDIIPK